MAAHPPLSAPAQVPEDDTLDLMLRLVTHVFSRVFEAEPTATWTAPGPLLLMGGDVAGDCLAVATRWGAKVAGRPRTDGVFEAAALHRLRERFVHDPGTASGPDEPPDWAAALPRLAAALLPADGGGASLLGYMDVPDESGILAGAAMRSCLATALAAMSATAADPETVITALGGDAEERVAHTASLLGRHGSAMLLSPASPTSPSYVTFDPAAAGLRLAVISARPHGEPPPARRPTSAGSEDARVARAFEAIASGDWAALGSLLTRSHEAARRHGDPSEGDLIVAASLAAGALGGRATSPATALVLMPTAAIQPLRAAVGAAFAGRGLPSPRFLTTGALPPLTARPESLLRA